MKAQRRLCLLTSFPLQGGKATSNRVQSFMNALMDFPDDIILEVISPPPPADFNALPNPRWRISTVDRGRARHRNLLKRAVSETLEAIRYYRAARVDDAQVLLVTVPSIMLLIPFGFLPSPKAHLVLDVRDAFWTYSTVGSKGYLVSLLLRFIFKRAAARATFITVTNERERQEVKALVDTDCFIVMNGIDRVRFLQLSALPIRRSVQEIKMLYVGNVGIAQQLDRTLDVIKSLSDLSFDVVGDGVELSNLRAKCAQENIGNVNFCGPASFDAVIDSMARADILFAQIGAAYASAIPTKVFEYLAAGRRVLLGVPDGSAKDVFSKFRGISIYDPDKPCELASALEHIRSTHLSEEDAEYNRTLLDQNFIRDVTVIPLRDRLHSIVCAAEGDAL